MSGMWWVVFLLVGTNAMLLVGWLAESDRKQGETRTTIPTITELPRAIAIPTAWRRR